MWGGGAGGGGHLRPSGHEMICFLWICVIDTIGYLSPECDADAWVGRGGGQAKANTISWTLKPRF